MDLVCDPALGPAPFAPPPSAPAPLGPAPFAPPPFARGSVSLRLYPHGDLDATATLTELCAQARVATEHGFDGVMTSEHHGGFGGYLPNPLQLAGFCLESMASGWAAPAPLLLPLRPAPLVVEEVAWLHARFPGRVGLGVAAGALPADFALLDVSREGLTDRFASGLAVITDALSGRDAHGLEGDAAIRACAASPIPVVSAAMGMTAVRRAARLGAGILLDSLTGVARCRALTDAYRAADGSGSCVLIRRAWVGQPFRQHVDAQVEVYRGYASSAVQGEWGGDELIAHDDASVVAERLATVLADAGADALNLRVHVPGIGAAAARAQIERLGTEVLGPLRTALQ